MMTALQPLSYFKIHNLTHSFSKFYYLVYMSLQIFYIDREYFRIINYNSRVIKKAYYFNYLQEKFIIS